MRPRLISIRLFQKKRPQQARKLWHGAGVLHTYVWASPAIDPTDQRPVRLGSGLSYFSPRLSEGEEKMALNDLFP